MFISTEVFLWLSGLEIAILLGLLIPILIQVMSLRGDLKPTTSVAKSVNDFFTARGLNSLSIQQSNQGHHSLTPKKAANRDALIAKGKIEGLTKIEADELKQLLLEDARDEVRSGTISPLAFGTLAVNTASIIEFLSIEPVSQKPEEHEMIKFAPKEVKEKSKQE